MAIGKKTIRQHKALHEKAVHQGIMMEKGRPVSSKKSGDTGMKSYNKGLEAMFMKVDKEENKFTTKKNIQRQINQYHEESESIYKKAKAMGKHK
jgi:hypothetical protein